MNFISYWLLKWQTEILFLLFIIGSIANILWSKKRIALLKDNIGFLQDKIQFFSNMTPKKVRTYYEVGNQELEKIIDNLELNLKKAENEIKEKDDKIEVLTSKGKELEDEIYKFKKSVKILEKYSNDPESAPIGMWFSIIKSTEKSSEATKELVANDEDLAEYLKEEHMRKHIESEAWERFLDETCGQPSLWCGVNNKKKDK